MGWVGFFVCLVEKGVLKGLFFCVDIPKKPDIPEMVDFFGEYGFSRIYRRSRRFVI